MYEVSGCPVGVGVGGGGEGGGARSGNALRSCNLHLEDKHFLWKKSDLSQKR